MKKITVNNSKDILIELDILNFENKNNYKLPLSYKDFLLKNNGGVPNENIFWNGVIEADVAYFYSLKYGNNNIESVMSNIHRDDALPKTFLPFASSGGGSMYAFSMEKTGYGEIYLFHFDGSDPFKLCESFEDFINNLEEDEF